MNKNRQRDFQQIRAEKGNKSYISDALSHSQSEISFISKSEYGFQKKKDVCITCVNTELKNHKIKAKETLRLMQKQQERQKHQNLNNINDIFEQTRTKMQKEATEMNKKLIQIRLQRQQEERQKDRKYIEESIKRQKEMDYQSQLEASKNQKTVLDYRRQLNMQRQIQKKNFERQKRLKKSISYQILPMNDQPNMQKKYHEDLKLQIQSNQKRKKLEKQTQKKIQKEHIKAAEKLIFNYTEYKNPVKIEQNPEIFDELKRIEKNKKDQKIKERLEMYQARKEEMQRQKNQLAVALRLKMQKMQKYYNTLKRQEEERKERQNQIKGNALEYLYSEQRQKQNQSMMLRICSGCKQTRESKYM